MRLPPSRQVAKEADWKCCHSRNAARRRWRFREAADRRPRQLMDCLVQFSAFFGDFSHFGLPSASRRRRPIDRPIARRLSESVRVRRFLQRQSPTVSFGKFPVSSQYRSGIRIFREIPAIPSGASPDFGRALAPARVCEPGSISWPGRAVPFMVALGQFRRFCNALSSRPPA